MVLNRVLAGFEGKLTNAKWAALGKCSADTALCDINEPLARGMLRRLWCIYWSNRAVSLVESVQAAMKIRVIPGC